MYNIKYSKKYYLRQMFIQPFFYLKNYSSVSNFFDNLSTEIIASICQRKLYLDEHYLHSMEIPQYNVSNELLQVHLPPLQFPSLNNTPHCICTPLYLNLPKILYTVLVKEQRMSSYVYVKNPNGKTYVYENTTYWDNRLSACRMRYYERVHDSRNRSSIKSIPT